MSVSYEGFKVNALTFKCSVKMDKGLPVKIYASNKVMECSDGEAFHGVVVDSDSKYSSVQVTGIVTLPYTGAAPATGYNNLVANGSGGAKLSTNGGRYLIVETDETAKTVTFLM